MSILIPLYVYPVPGAWDPLYTAAKAHPDVTFTTIINPCSGPCDGSLPDQVYLDEIPKLKTFDNIRALGYVATDYGDKEIARVLAEIDVYADWPRASNDTKMKLDGIFFDETPSKYAAGNYEYLKTASQAVKSGSGFKDRFVVHNPGLIDPAVLNSTAVFEQTFINLTDITVVFEDRFDKWLEAAVFDALHDSKVKPSKLAVILHSVPDISKTVLDFVVEQVEETADWLFLTDVNVMNEYYHSFSAMFANVVASVDGSEARLRGPFGACK